MEKPYTVRRLVNGNVITFAPILIPFNEEQKYMAIFDKGEKFENAWNVDVWLSHEDTLKFLELQESGFESYQNHLEEAKTPYYHKGKIIQTPQEYYSSGMDSYVI